MSSTSLAPGLRAIARAASCPRTVVPDVQRRARSGTPRRVLDLRLTREVVEHDARDLQRISQKQAQRPHRRQLQREPEAVEPWAEIRRMRFVAGVSIQEIARGTGRDRNTVRRALRSEEPPRYVGRPGPSKLTRFRD